MRGGWPGQENVAVIIDPSRVRRDLIEHEKMAGLVSRRVRGRVRGWASRTPMPSESLYRRWTSSWGESDSVFPLIVVVIVGALAAVIVLVPVIVKRN